MYRGWPFWTALFYTCCLMITAETSMSGYLPQVSHSLSSTRKGAKGESSPGRHRNLGAKVLLRRRNAARDGRHHLRLYHCGRPIDPLLSAHDRVCLVPHSHRTHQGTSCHLFASWCYATFDPPTPRGGLGLLSSAGALGLPSRHGLRLELGQAWLWCLLCGF